MDEAIRYVNSRPKPLALYVCATKQKVFKKSEWDPSSLLLWYTALLAC